MSFTETTFLFVFLPVSITMYLLVDIFFHNTRANNLVLVFFSLLFYYWANKTSIIFLFLITLFLFISGKLLEKEESPSVKKTIHLLITLLIGLLAIYKYASSIANWINQVIDLNIISPISLIMPIGLSFIVFESISYLIDIYRGDAQAQSLLNCLVFTSLFPKIVSGPIVLWKDFSLQLNDRRSTIVKITDGLDRIIIGYAKKVILADSFGIQLQQINNGLAGAGVDFQTMWLRAVLYFFQIYFDFSGYSDIALGICSIFGFEIKENFCYPYLSKTVTEFWRRWHISLGTWFREYIYIPLGGNRRGNVYIHLLIVFILTGIWHGKGLQFLLWGAVHGVAVCIERAIQDKDWYSKIPGVLKWFLTAIFILFTWIVFMSKDLASARNAILSLFVSTNTDSITFTWRYYLTNRTILFLLIAVIGHLFGIKTINTKAKALINTKVGCFVKRLLLLVLFIIDVVYIVNSTFSPFIYFQF